VERGEEHHFAEGGTNVVNSYYLDRQRSIVTAVALAALAIGAVSGCQAGTTARAASSSTRSTTSTGTTTPGGPAGASSGAPVPADRTLGDDGIGGLSLGLSKRAAIATGLVGPKKTDLSNDDCEVHTGQGDIEFVYFVAGKVSIIAVGPAIRLAEGIGVGDTYRDLHAKYPVATDDGPGRLAVDAPGAKVAAHYRIAVDDDVAYPDSKITEIALQANDQPCYE